MFTRRTFLIVSLLVVTAFGVSAAVLTRLPQEMATHWGPGGSVDGYSGRNSGAFAIPVIMLALAGLFGALPRIAPAAPDLPRGRARVTAFVVVLLGFLLALHAQLLLWNLGTEISFRITVPVGLGLLFIFIGRMLGAVEPNWVVGIRTYWTLKHPVVWERTHQRAGMLFNILGVIYIAAAFFRDYILFFILLPAVFLALYLPVYSFTLYQKIQKVEELGRKARGDGHDQQK